MLKKALSALVLMLALAVVAFAQAPGPAGRNRQGGLLREFMSARVQARLNLTADQVKQLQDIVRAQRAKMQAPVNVAAERQAMMKAIFTDAPNQAEIDKHAAALASQQNQRLNQMVSTMLEFNQVLTPEQRTEFQKMLDEQARAGTIRRQRMQQWRHPRMNPPSPGAAPQAAPPPQQP